MPEPKQERRESQESDEFIKLDYPAQESSSLQNIKLTNESNTGYDDSPTLEQIAEDSPTKPEDPEVLLVRRSVHKDKKDDVKILENQKSCTKNVSKITQKKSSQVPLRFGPMPKNEKAYTQIVLILAAAIVTGVMYHTRSQREQKFAPFKENIDYRLQTFPCDEGMLREFEADYNIKAGECGRFVMDNVVKNKETDLYLKFAKKLFKHNKNFKQNIYFYPTCRYYTTQSYFKEFNTNNIYYNNINYYFRYYHANVLNLIALRIKGFLTEHFNLRGSILRLVSPIYISRMDADLVDYRNILNTTTLLSKAKLPMNHYTVIIFLNGGSTDIAGGTHVFVNSKSMNSVIEPKKNRILAFSSGSENEYFVRNITYGVRYTLTLSFSSTDLAMFTPFFVVPQLDFTRPCKNPEAKCGYLV